MAATDGRKRRTWSAFGEVRRMPSEYEIVTEGTNWTLREGRRAALEQNPSSPANQWFMTYRDGSALEVPSWNAFRDPDHLTYRTYVAIQSEQEHAVAGALDEYSDHGHDGQLPNDWVQLLQMLFTTTRFPLHAAQQVQAYIAYMSPSPYIMNAASFAAADLLRRVSLVAYRTRELQLARPEAADATIERQLWQDHEAWQPARKLIETAMVAYDWAEAFTAMNLVILPTLDELLLGELRRVAHARGDDLTWILLGYLNTDSERRARWSAALATFSLQQRPDNRTVFAKWIEKWAARTDPAIEALAGSLMAVDPDGRTSAELARAAVAARRRLHELSGIVSSQVAADEAETVVTG